MTRREMRNLLKQAAPLTDAMKGVTDWQASQPDMGAVQKATAVKPVPKLPKPVAPPSGAGLAQGIKPPPGNTDHSGAAAGVGVGPGGAVAGNVGRAIGRGMDGATNAISGAGTAIGRAMGGAVSGAGTTGGEPNHLLPGAGGQQPDYRDADSIAADQAIANAQGTQPQPGAAGGQQPDYRDADSIAADQAIANAQGAEGQPGAAGTEAGGAEAPAGYDMNTDEGQQAFATMYDGGADPDWSKIEITEIPPEQRAKLEESLASNERLLGSLTKEDMERPDVQEMAKKALRQKMMLQHAGQGTNPETDFNRILEDGISHEELTGKILNDETALAQVTERAAAAGQNPEAVRGALEKAQTPGGRAQVEAESPGMMESIIGFFTDMDPGMQLLLAAGAGMAIGGAMGMGGMGGIAAILGVLGIGGAIMGGIFGGKGGSGEATEPGKPPAEGGAMGGAYTGENSRGSVTGGPANPPVEVNGVMMYDQGDGTMGPEEPLAEPFANPPADGTEAPTENFNDGSTGGPGETPVEGGAGGAAPAESAFPGDADGNGEFNPQEIADAMGEPAVIKSMVNHPNAQVMFQKAYHAEPPNKEFRAKVMKIRGFKPEEMDMVVDGYPGVLGSGYGAQPGLVEQLGVDRPTAVKMFQLAQNL
jgi:hypothetical protein